MLEPSDGYVGDFLKNINRGRVVEIGAIMSPMNGVRPKLTLADKTVLEDALVELVQNKGRSARVVNDAGDEVGYVALDDVVDAIARPAQAAG